MHLILKPEDPLNFSHCTGVHVRTLHIEDFIYMLKFKPSLHISTVYKLIRIESSCLRILLLSFPLMPWSSYSCNDRRYSYFIRNICNRYADSFKILLWTWSQACSAIVTTIWRSGFRSDFFLMTLQFSLMIAETYVMADLRNWAKG